MIRLPGQDGEYRLEIPCGYPVEVLSPRLRSVSTPFAELLRSALADPIASKPLAELVRPQQKILVVCDDNTRTTPVDRALPILLADLMEAGCSPTDITLAIALGTHRCMTPAEIDRKLGREVAAQFPVINDPAQKADAFVPTGELLNGAPVEVHRAVLEADFVLTIGSVVPHSEAGWSGGCKMILPGMCSERTVMENHRLAASFAGNALGQETTPVRQNMEEIVARIGLDFSINLVLTPAGEVTGVFAGHFVAAQRAAARAAREVFAVAYRERADIVVSNAYPAEIDFWQASKGIFSGQLLVKPGGTVILNAPCPEGIGPHPDFLQFIQAEPHMLEADLASGALRDISAAALALPVTRMLDHMRLSIVSPGLPASHFGSGRVSHHLDLTGALRAALDMAPACAPADGASASAMRIGVITHGGYTFPFPALN